MASLPLQKIKFLFLDVSRYTSQKHNVHTHYVKWENGIHIILWYDCLLPIYLFSIIYFWVFSLFFLRLNFSGLVFVSCPLLTLWSTKNSNLYFLAFTIPHSIVFNSHDFMLVKLFLQQQQQKRSKEKPKHSRIKNLLQSHESVKNSTMLKITIYFVILVLVAV